MKGSRSGCPRQGGRATGGDPGFLDFLLFEVSGVLEGEEGENQEKEREGKGEEAGKGSSAWRDKENTRRKPSPPEAKEKEKRGQAAADNTRLETQNPFHPSATTAHLKDNTTKDSRSAKKLFVFLD